MKSPTDAAELPTGWKPKPGVTMRTEADVVIPPRASDDPAILGSWYGAFGFFDHWRKVRLSLCRELERGKHADQKVTEAKLDDLAHTHPAYVAFLTEHLYGRQLWEKEVEHRGLGG
jgi:hypothetical protein